MLYNVISQENQYIMVKWSTGLVNDNDKVTGNFSVINAC